MKKRNAAIEFFSRPRTLQECQDMIRRYESTRKYWMAKSNDTNTLYGAEEVLCDIFMDEMCELDLHFKR